MTALRQVVLDTETTGLEVGLGHRVIEIGCVELHNRRRTERSFHQYLNPEREIDDGAVDVHGIRASDLADKPRFADVAREFLEFVRGSELIIHNAPFDVEFIDSELKRLGSEWGGLADHCTVLDTLALARELHPGQKNSLDALCTRYDVDNSDRDLHGALLDAQLLADVYLAMTGGQAALLLDEDAAGGPGMAREHRRLERGGRALALIMPTPEEEEAHRRRLEAIEREGGRCIWLALERGD